MIDTDCKSIHIHNHPGNRNAFVFGMKQYCDMKIELNVTVSTGFMSWRNQTCTTIGRQKN